MEISQMNSARRQLMLLAPLMALGACAPQAPPRKPITTGRPIKVNTAANMRSGPGISNDVLMVVPQGQIVYVIGAVRHWSKVRHNGAIGYIHDSLLGKRRSRAEPKSPEAADAISVKPCEVAANCADGDAAGAVVSPEG